MHFFFLPLSLGIKMLLLLFFLTCTAEMTVTNLRIDCNSDVFLLLLVFCLSYPEHSCMLKKRESETERVTIVHGIWLFSVVQARPGDVMRYRMCAMRITHPNYIIINKKKKNIIWGAWNEKSPEGIIEKGKYLEWWAHPNWIGPFWSDQYGKRNPSRVQHRFSSNKSIQWSYVQCLMLVNLCWWTWNSNLCHTTLHLPNTRPTLTVVGRVRCEWKYLIVKHGYEDLRKFSDLPRGLFSYSVG